MKSQKSVEYSDVSNTPIIQSCASTIGTCSEAVRIVLSVKKNDKNGKVVNKSFVKWVPMNKQKSEFVNQLNKA
jgi:sporulation protein YlmC with PRC-barrel domain